MGEHCIRPFFARYPPEAQTTSRSSFGWLCLHHLQQVLARSPRRCTRLALEFSRLAMEVVDIADTTEFSGAAADDDGIRSCYSVDSFDSLLSSCESIAQNDENALFRRSSSTSVANFNRASSAGGLCLNSLDLRLHVVGVADSDDSSGWPALLHADVDGWCGVELRSPLPVSGCSSLVFSAVPA